MDAIAHIDNPGCVVCYVAVLVAASDRALSNTRPRTVCSVGILQGEVPSPINRRRIVPFICVVKARKVMSAKKQCHLNAKQATICITFVVIKWVEVIDIG